MTVWIRSCRLALVLWAVVSILVVGGCKRKSPTEPEPPPPPPPQILPPVSPGPVRLVDLNLADRTVVVEWNNPPGAQSFTVAYDSADGRRQFDTDGNITRMALADLATDQPSDIQVQARNQAGTSAAATATFLIPNFQDVVEALFFGTGPYADGQFAWNTEIIVGFAPGTDVRVRVDHTINDERLGNLTRFLHEVPGLTLGSLHGHVAEIGDISEQRAVDEIKVLVREDISAPCGPTAVGCASMARFVATPFWLNFGLVWLRSTVLPVTVSHEMAHAMLGLNHVVVPFVRWHIAGENIPTPTMAVHRTGNNLSGTSTREPGQTLTPLEAEIVQLVYGSGLRPGTSRGEFYGRGLIRNATVSFAHVRSRSGQITQDGTVTVNWVCP